MKIDDSFTERAKCFDAETSTYAKGNAYSRKGKLVSIHTYNGEEAKSYRPEDFEEDWIGCLGVVFNGKFDVAWLRRNGNKLPERVWDVQLAHFLLSGQLSPYPSLDEVLTHYGLPLKHNVVKEEYWKRGIDTDQVPWDILCEYGEYDCIGPYNCFLKQRAELRERPLLYRLFLLQCQDLLVLQEMEHNGLKYNNKKCEEKSDELQKKIDGLNEQLSSVYPGIPINFSSNDQLSAFLYGGTIAEELREVIGFYKTGVKIGHPRFRVSIQEHILPQLVKPLPRSEMKREGVYATDEGTLKKLRGTKKAKEVIGYILELAKLEKLNGTYYKGLNKLVTEMDWEEGTLHPTYNQCNAKTGRLSSAKPNGQNLSGEILEVFESIYQ